MKKYLEMCTCDEFQINPNFATLNFSNMFREFSIWVRNLSAVVYHKFESGVRCTVAPYKKKL